jgi:DNA invertase Pin-like site-specific DNA recombinase
VARGKASKPVEVRCAIYVRISHDPNNEELGIERQIKACRELAQQRGWPIVDIYRDNDKSAYDLKVRRLDYERMVADIRKGHVNAIVAWSGDRIHRRLSKLTQLIDLLNKHDVQVATVTGGRLDLATAQGRAFAQIVGVLAEMESGIKSERIKLKHDELAGNGKFSGGSRPFGYSADGMTINEAEAAVIRQWAADILNGKPLSQMADEAAARGVKGASGRPISYRRIPQILRSAHIAGQRVHHGEVIGKGEWAAILDLDTWQAVQLLLDDPDRRQAPTADYLLTGLLFVAEHPDGSCDSGGQGKCLHPAAKMTGHIKDELPHYRGKGAQLRASHVEARIVDAALIRSDEARIEPRKPAVHSDASAELQEIAAEIALIKAAQNARELSTKDAIDLMRPLNRRKAEAEAARADELMAPLSHAWLNQPGKLRKLWNEVDDEGAPVMSQAQRRDALAELIEWVTVMPPSPERQAGVWGAAFDVERLRVKWRQPTAASTPKAA